MKNYIKKFVNYNKKSNLLYTKKISKIKRDFADIYPEPKNKKKPLLLEQIKIEENYDIPTFNQKKENINTNVEWSSLNKEDLNSFTSSINKQILVSNFRSIALTLLIAFIAVFIVNQFFFILSVPSSSMEPTMNPNEKFLTTKIMGEELDYGIYGFYSDELDMRLVKRLVGKPGDVIEFDKGKLIRNGEEVVEDYVLYDSYFSGTYTVPENKYLFIGDNRSNSIDARFWKDPYIEKDKIIGKVLLRIHPYFRFGLIE